MLRTASDQSTFNFEYPTSPKLLRGPRINSVSLGSPIMEKKRLSRKLSRSNSDADILGGEDCVKNEKEGITEEARRRSHSIDELLLSGEGQNEVACSLETASNKIEEILGNDRKFSRSSSSRPIFKTFVNLKRREGKVRKVQRSSSQCEEEIRSGNTTPVESISCDNSPSVSRKKAMIKKVRKSLLLNFNHDHSEESELQFDETASNSSNERQSSSPPDDRGGKHYR